MQRLRSEVAQDECAIAPSQESLKTAEWRLGLDVDATSQNLETRLHAVECVPSEGRAKPAQFILTRFVFTNKLGKDEKLLLAFDAFVLSEILGRGVSLGKIIHGDDHSTLKVKTSSPGRRGAEATRKKLPRCCPATRPPDLVLNRHCTECEFQARCRQRAIEKDDLSLLARMSEKERKKLRSKGIFTVTQLSYTFRPRRRPKRLRDKREKYHHSLKALAIREKKIHIVGSPELKIEGTPVYLDVEGLPDRDFYYLIGVRIGNGESAIQHSLWADTVGEEGKIWREVPCHHRNRGEAGADALWKLRDDFSQANARTIWETTGGFCGGRSHSRWDESAVCDLRAGLLPHIFQWIERDRREPWVSVVRLGRERDSNRCLATRMGGIKTVCHETSAYHLQC